MSLFGNLTGLLGGSGKTTIPITFAPGEQELARCVGCTVKGNGFPWFGGDLVLTNQRAIFTPLNLKDAAALLDYGLKKMGGPEQASKVITWILEQGAQQDVGLDGISNVRPNLGKAVLHPPTLVFERRDGTQVEFGALAGRTKPNWSKDNEPARDAFIRAIQLRLV